MLWVLVIAVAIAAAAMGRRTASSGVRLAGMSWVSRLATPQKLDRRFLAKWLSMESGGNPCKIGEMPGPATGGRLKEAGIGQVYFDKEGQTSYGVTLGQLRGACGTGPTRKDYETQLRELTEQEKDWQWDSFVTMANDCYRKAASQLMELGLPWTNADTYRLAKLYHGVPAIAKHWLPLAKSGSFHEFQEWSFQKANAKQLGRLRRAFDNADRCGSVIEGEVS